MIDTEADILKAFFVALALQTQPLPHEVQLALNNISETDNLANQIDSLAESYEPLKTLYEEAYNWLVEHGNQQRKGRDIKPQASSETETTLNTELDNVASEITDSNSLPTILSKIQKRLTEEKNVSGKSQALNTWQAILAKIQERLNTEQGSALAPKIFYVADSVQSAQEIFLSNLNQ